MRHSAVANATLLFAYFAHKDTITAAIVSLTMGDISLRIIIGYTSRTDISHLLNRHRTRACIRHHESVEIHMTTVTHCDATVVVPTVDDTELRSSSSISSLSRKSAQDRNAVGTIGNDDLFRVNSSGNIDGATSRQFAMVDCLLYASASILP